MSDRVAHDGPVSETIEERGRRRPPGSRVHAALVVRLLATLALALAGVVVAAGAASGASASNTHVRSQGAHQRTRHALRRRAVDGKVTAVNGSTAAGSCGTAGASGAFTLRSFHGATRTVDVTSSTTFSAAPSSGAVSFATVCVGTDVAVSGHPMGAPHTLTATRVVLLPIPATTTAAPTPPPPAAAGKVTSVDGSSTAGTCGTAGATGTFALDSFKGATVDVGVTSSTTFVGSPPAAPATFAEVCVGSDVAALGTAASTPAAFTAAKVFELSPHPMPPRPPAAVGKVTSVDGASTAGSCGTAGGAGTFALSSFKGATVDVAVTSSTTFSDPADTSPSNADVCVGTDVAALGTATSTPTSFTAAKVFVFPPHPPRQDAAGKVTSVDGASTAGSCGTAGGTGTFALSSFKDATLNADVTSSTTFSDPGAASPSYADVCVGDGVAVLGAAASTPTTLTAAKVFVFTPHTPPSPPPVVAGKVTAVDGASTAGTCGTAGGTGTFTVMSFRGSSVTVDVTSSTTFNDASDASPSYADVCVGSDVAALGAPASTATAFTATKVFVFAPHPAGPGVHGLVPVPGLSHGPSAGDAATRPSATVPRGSGSHAPGSFASSGTTQVSGTVAAKTPTSIVLSHNGQPQTVDVNASTTYTGLSGPSSLALVGTGDLVRATGTVARGVFTASTVTVLPPVGPTPSGGSLPGGFGDPGHGGAPAPSPFGQHQPQGVPPTTSSVPPTRPGAPGPGAGQSPTPGGTSQGSWPSGAPRGGSSPGGGDRR